MRSKTRIFSLPRDHYPSKGRRVCPLWMMTFKPQYVPRLIFFPASGDRMLNNIFDLIPYFSPNYKYRIISRRT